MASRYSLKGTSHEPPSTGLGVPQVPGVPLVRMRAEQASPVLQVPLPPVPQHGWLAAPQVAQTLPEAASVHSCGAAHAVTPLSAAPGPPPVGQQSWSVPPHAPQVPAVLAVVSRPEQTSPVLQVPLLPWDRMVSMIRSRCVDQSGSRASGLRCAPRRHPPQSVGTTGAMVPSALNVILSMQISRWFPSPPGIAQR